MTRAATIPAAADDPVAVALKDEGVRTRMAAAARVCLSRRADLASTQLTAEAEAIVQEAALRAWNHRDHFDPSKDALTWLVGYVWNVAREYARKRSRDKTASPDDKRRLEELAVDQAKPFDDALADKQLAGHLLQQLSEPSRTILQMKYEEDLTCGEIAQRLGLNENAVRVRVFRAIQELKRLCGITGEGQQ